TDNLCKAAVASSQPPSLTQPLKKPGFLWEALLRLRRSAVAQQTLACGRELARDAVNAVYQKNRVIVHRRQAASHGSM
ncbi:hypothetical protein, partial [Pseudomonas viridiflava]|uniref:hypothetical protein n=1 Tax=Pseudomonas viridiflava TaxID=33069 RepID=UPI0019D08F1E